jgi:hypothetical protein
VTQPRCGAVPAGPAGGHGLADVADAGAFLARLTRLDPAAVVRLRSAGPPGSAGRTALWARLPWQVLVGRTVAGEGPGDVTVGAAELLAELGRAGPGLPIRRDGDWRWPLPGSAGRQVEALAGADLRRIAAAAAGALRDAADGGVGGRAVGQRAVRDALLDHVAVVVTERPESAPDAAGPAPGRIEVSQRLVQAVVRMGFLGPEDPGADDRVRVRVAGRWIGLSAPYGVAWLPMVSMLALRPAGDRPNG